MRMNAAMPACTGSKRTTTIAPIRSEIQSPVTLQGDNPPRNKKAIENTHEITKKMQNPSQNKKLLYDLDEMFNLGMVSLL
jgi:hypothetical protein